LPRSPWRSCHQGLMRSASVRLALELVDFIKNPGLLDAPLPLVDSLQRIIRLVLNVMWPRMLVNLTSDELASFLRDLTERYLRDIRRSKEARPERRREPSRGHQ